MDTLFDELLKQIIKEVDTSTQLSLWWTAKSFRSFISLPKINRDEILLYPGADGNIEIFQWLYSLDYKITDDVLLDVGKGGNIELIKFCIDERKLNSVDMVPLLNGAAEGAKVEAYKYVKFLSSERGGLRFAVQGESIEIFDLVFPYIRKDTVGYIIVLLTYGSDKLISHCIDHYKIEFHIWAVNHNIDKIQSSVFVELFRRKILNKSSILCAIQYGRFDCIENIDLSSFDRNDTAFMGAISTFATRNENCYKIIQKLYTEGFIWHPNAQRVICSFDDLELVKIALQNVNPSGFYILNISNVDVFTYCIERGFEIDYDTTIHYCIEDRNIALLKCIVSTKNYNPPRITERFTALLQCTPEMFDLLYPRNEDFGNAKLNMFFQSNNTELAIHLVKRGVKITTYYPELAIQHGHLDVFRAMHETGSNMVRIDNGLAINLALLHKRYDILQYAVENGYHITDDARKEIRTMPQYCHLLGDDIY